MKLPAALGFMGLALFSVHAQLVNNWTNSSSGRWDSISSWSLGILPASNQWVTIRDNGFLAVNIDSGVAATNPSSMTVASLLVGAPDLSYSTLLLNYFGQSMPFRVLNACVITNNGVVENLASSFEVDGTLSIYNGSYQQVGGLAVIHSPVNVQSGFLRATNANLTLGQTTLGTPQGDWGYIQHDASNLAIDFLNILRGSYTLVSGNLYALQGTQVGPGAEAAFFQFGGTNYGNITLMENSAYQQMGGLAQGNVLSVSSALDHSVFTLESGLLQMQFINVTAGTNSASPPGFQLDAGTVRCGALNIGGNGLFGQEGGHVVLTNALDMHGEFFIVPHIGPLIETSNYLLNDGELEAPSITLGRYATFRQFGGNVALPGNLTLEGTSVTYMLGGGNLTTSSTEVGLTAKFSQTGGQHQVNGVLSITGAYDLQNGSIVTAGIYLRGSLSLSNNAMFANTGLLNLGGILSTAITNAGMGQLQLATNAIVVFSGHPSRLQFNPSADVAWASGAILTITNWSSTTGSRVFFGTNSTGLIAAQLAQVQFANPDGFVTGLYPAQLLPSGELVPLPRPTLKITPAGSAVVLTWPGPYNLLCSTNVDGPYVTVPGASSPWTIPIVKAREYFMLQGL